MTPTSTTPVSIPADPPQPPLASYPPAALNRVQTYDRAAYNKAFGIDPPTYDETKKSKSWFDSTAASLGPDTIVNYQSYVDNGGPITSETLAMTAAEAAAVNLSGVHTYPAYVIAPTSATYGGNPLNPAALSMQSDAAGLASELTGNSANIVDTDTPGLEVYPASELRRMWAVICNGTQLNAGMLLQSEYANGVGAPGQWDLSGPEPAWISDLPNAATQVINPYWDVPMRALLSNEATAATPFGWCVYRTDMPSSFNTGNGSSTTTFQTTSLGLLNRIATKLGA